MDSELQCFKLPPSFSSFPQFMDSNSDLMALCSSNPVLIDNHFTNNLISFSNDMVFSSPPDHNSGNSSTFHIRHQANLNPNLNPNFSTQFHDVKKRKSIDVSETSSRVSTPQSPFFNTKNGLGKGKRLKSIEKDEENSTTREVVHVRARRGQATDSHSLAERVRRGKINERLRCLKDIVPGCYKTMGMAVMLDEIINYVQSLQNQVEFLSMKLAAASSFYDFNSESDSISKLQREKVNEAKELERLMREGYGGVACFHSTLPH